MRGTPICLYVTIPSQREEKLQEPILDRVICHGTCNYRVRDDQRIQIMSVIISSSFFWRSHEYLIHYQKRRFSCSLSGHVDAPNHVDLLNLDWLHSLNMQSNLFETRDLLMSILVSTPNHIPLKHRRPHYCYVGLNTSPSVVCTKYLSKFM